MSGTMKWIIGSILQVIVAQTEVKEFVGEWHTLAKESVVHDIPVVYKQWTLSFLIEPLGKVGEWSSIFRVGSTGGASASDGNYGDRNPSIFFSPSSTTLYSTGSVNNNWNYVGTKTEGELPLNEKTQVDVSQLKVGDDYIYSMSINGEVIHQATNNQAQEFTNGKLAISDNKYVPANAKISDLTYRTFPDGHVFVESASKFAKQNSTRFISN